jgi:pimeloyl-ACP methyl ester carboxylesterase
MLFVAETGSRDLPPLLMLHGVGGNHQAFAPQLDGLANAAWCLAWDMPGYGQSTANADMTWDSLCESIVQLLDERDIRQVNLLGHSLGGMLALEFAHRYPQRLQSLILYATSPAFGNQDGTFQEKFLRARLAPLEQGASMTDIANKIVPGMLHAEHQHLAQQLITIMGQVTTPAYAQALTCITQFDQRANLATINVPCRLISGHQDPNAPAALMAKMARKIPHADHVNISDCGHFANLEQVAAFNQTIKQHLSQLSRLAPKG